MDDQGKDYDGPQRPNDAPYGGSTKIDVPAIGITLQYPLDEGAGRGLVFQTFVAADCRPGELNEALDKVRKAADRQRAIVVLPTFRGMLQDRKDALKEEVGKHLEIETTRDQRNNVEAQNNPTGRRRDRATPQQNAEDAKFTQALANSKGNMALIKKEIAIYERKIEDAEKLIADGA